jgi:hypothetical protein
VVVEPGLELRGIAEEDRLRGVGFRPRRHEPRVVGRDLVRRRAQGRGLT